MFSMDPPETVTLFTVMFAVRLTVSPLPIVKRSAASTLAGGRLVASSDQLPGVANRSPSFAPPVQVRLAAFDVLATDMPKQMVMSVVEMRDGLSFDLFFIGFIELRVQKPPCRGINAPKFAGATGGAGSGKKKVFPQGRLISGLILVVRSNGVTSRKFVSVAGSPACYAAAR